MVECRICGKKLKAIWHLHLRVHGITLDQYREMFPDAPTMCEDEQRRRSTTAKGLWESGCYDHLDMNEMIKAAQGGAKDYWTNLSDEERVKISRQRSETAKELRANGVYGEEHCKALSDALLAYYQTEEGKKNRESKVDAMSERMIAWHADPDNKELCSRLRSKEMTRRMTDPEEREKISQAMKKWWNDHPEHQKKMARVRAAQSQNGPTSIELILYDLLDRLALQYTTQIAIGKYAVDALIEGWLAVEADGDYWHSLPGMAERDERKNQYLWERGYQVLRFRGSDLRDNLEMCANRITYVMECT